MNAVGISQTLEKGLVSSNIIFVGKGGDSQNETFGEAYPGRNLWMRF